MSLEFFCGIGGFHSALRQSNFDYDVVCAFDVSPNSNEVYKIRLYCFIIDINLIFLLQMDNRKFHNCLTVSQIEEYNAKIWLLSPPCQPHTRNGLKLGGDDPRSNAFHHLMDILTEITIKPEYILLENVEGFEVSDSHNLLISTIKKLEYNYQEFLLSPNQFSIPNQRDRYFFLSKLSTPFTPVEHQFIIENNLCRIIPGDEQCKFIKNNAITGEMGTLENNQKWNELNSHCKPISSYLKPEEKVNENSYLSDSILSKNSSMKCVDIISPLDKYSICFTKAYRKFFRGSGSLIQTNLPYLTPPITRDFENLKKMKLRYFESDEIKSIFGYDKDFVFPESMSERTRCSLLGNSLNVTVVTHLMNYLFS